MRRTQESNASGWMHYHTRLNGYGLLVFVKGDRITWSVNDFNSTVAEGKSSSVEQAKRAAIRATPSGKAAR